MQEAQEKKVFSKNLSENEEYIRKVFAGDDTFVLRKIETRDNTPCFIAYFDGMVSAAVIDLHIVKPLQEAEVSSDIESLCGKTVSTEQAESERDVRKALLAMEAGDTLVFIEGSDAVLVCSTKGFKTRSIEEPDIEKYLRGPKEGFTESLMVNTTLIRRRILSPDLKIEMFTPVKNSGERFALCYLENSVDKKILSNIRMKLENLNLPLLLSSNHLEENLCRRWQLFKTMGVTEKPDVAAAKLMEGRVAVICEGSPNVLTAPFVFLEYFQTGSDYYGNFWYGSIQRVLRILGTFLSVSVPAIYISLVCFHQEMLPTELLISISASREGVPLSSVFETFLMLIAFELLRSAGIMMPKGIGDALSTVGGVVIGQAAVDARFISAPLVIMIAFTGLTEMLIPKLKGPVFISRIYLLLLSSFVGIYGYIIGILSIMVLLNSKESFGLPYMSYFDELRPANLKDTLVRAPLPLLRLHSIRPKK